MYIFTYVYIYIYLHIHIYIYLICIYITGHPDRDHAGGPADYVLLRPQSMGEDSRENDANG